MIDTWEAVKVLAKTHEAQTKVSNEDIFWWISDIRHYMRSKSIKQMSYGEFTVQDIMDTKELLYTEIYICYGGLNGMKVHVERKTIDSGFELAYTLDTYLGKDRTKKIIRWIKYQVITNQAKKFLYSAFLKSSTSDIGTLNEYS